MATSNATLFLNAYEKTISYKGVQKQINDSYWEANIVPILYPLWDNPKDRLELFVYRENGQYLIEKNKYKKNFKTGETKWVSYEFDPAGVEEISVSDLVDKITEKFVDYKEQSEAEYEKAVQEKFAIGQLLTWAKVKLVRLFLLQDSDYTQHGDAPVTAEEKALWVQYRHYLREFLSLQNPQSPYDVIFPITPKEYLDRKAFDMDPLIIEAYGNQGADEDYLNSSYHFWKLSSNALASFSQRMSTYIALKSHVASNGQYGRIEVTKYILDDTEGKTGTTTTDSRSKIVDKYGSEQGAQDYLNALMTRIENGEI